jgi:hypothetical protein
MVASQGVVAWRRLDQKSPETKSGVPAEFELKCIKGGLESPVTPPTLDSVDSHV